MPSLPMHLARYLGLTRAEGPEASVRLPALLLAGVYSLGARLRRQLYSRGWLPVKRLPAPVISVGNLTVGGTGKTPMVACLARYFQGRGEKVAILSRGYGGRRKSVTCLSDGETVYFKPPEVGEEAYWLARSLPGAAVYTCPSRYEAGLAAWREFKPDLFLLDDGFQHFQLNRDLDIVLLDAAAPFGIGQVLPRGRLREPVSALTAAQVLILTRFEPERHQEQLQSVRKRFPGKTVLTATIQPVAVRRYPGGEAHPLDILRGRPLLAFAGLARPEVFSRTLEDLEAVIKGFQAFPDHYAFGGADLRSLLQAARKQGAETLITTSKDFARLGDSWEGDLPLWVLEVEARVDQSLDSLMGRWG